MLMGERRSQPWGWHKEDLTVQRMMQTLLCLPIHSLPPHALFQQIYLGHYSPHRHYRVLLFLIGLDDGHSPHSHSRYLALVHLLDRRLPPHCMTHFSMTWCTFFYRHCKQPYLPWDEIQVVSDVRSLRTRKNLQCLRAVEIDMMTLWFYSSILRCSLQPLCHYCRLPLCVPYRRHLLTG